MFFRTQYFGVDAVILWRAVEVDIPKLVEAMSGYLAEEGADAGAD